MRQAILLFACIAAAMLAAGGELLVVEKGASAQVADYPNFVVIMTDDLDERSMEHLSGIREIMNSEGTTFGNAYVTYPYCCPSRATFFRGQYTHNHNIIGNFSPLGGETKFRALGRDRSTIATWLDDAGYRTMYIGRYMTHYVDLYVPPGWDEWFALSRDKVNDNGQYVTLEGHSTDMFAKKASDFIRRSSANPEPFFVMVGTKAPHNPPEVAERYQDRFADALLPRPPNFDEEDISDKPQWLQSYPRLSYNQIDRLQNMHRDRLCPMLSVEDLLRQTIATLRETGELENTYVFFISDNGFHMGLHRLFAGKLTAYEEDIGVPLVVRGPDVPAGAVRQQTIINNDLAPTIADLAGVPTPTFVDGRSFSPLLTDSPPPAWRTAFLVEGWMQENAKAEKIPTYNAIHTRNHTFVEYETGEHELYDLVLDPYQLESKSQSGDELLYSKLAARLQNLKNCASDSCREAEFGRAASAPDTTIDSGPSGYVDSGSASFTFSSSVPGSTFRCSLDGAFFADCSSPREYAGLSEGEHAFFVQAIDAAGNADPSPASRTWTVDTTPPTAISVAPEDGAAGVDAKVNIEVVFSEAIDASTVTSSTFTLFEQGSDTPVPAVVSYDPAGKRATLDPDTDLKPGAGYPVTVKGGDGGVKDLSGKLLAADKVWSFTTRSDIAPPVVQPPGQRLFFASTLSTSAVPVKLAWSATDDQSGVSAYQLQQSTNRGAYADLKLSSATSTTKVVRLLPGKSYRFRWRASDEAGNWSEWAYGPEFFVDAYQETSDAIAYGGAWTDESSASSYGGTIRYAEATEASALFTFTGSDVAWVASRGPDRGKAEVWIDGLKHKTVDLYRSASQACKVMLTKSWDSPGSHVLEVRVLGTKNAASSGTRVDVDVFVALR